MSVATQSSVHQRPVLRSLAKNSSAALPPLEWQSAFLRVGALLSYFWLSLRRHRINQRCLNTASVAGLVSAADTGPYTVSKHAVVALSEVLVADLRKRNSRVGVSIICPSFVNTKIYAAERNRPLPTSLQHDEHYHRDQAALAEAASEFFAHTLSPDRVAEQVFEAIERREFYILPHPEGSRAAIAQRFDGIAAGEARPLRGPEEYPFS